MSETIEAVYEHGVFRPLHPVSLPEGERVQVTLPDAREEIQRRLTALQAFDTARETLTEAEWRLFDDAVQRRPWFGARHRHAGPRSARDQSPAGRAPAMARRP